MITKYNPDTDTFEDAFKLPVCSRAGSASFVREGRLYVTGGTPNPRNIISYNIGDEDPGTPGEGDGRLGVTMAAGKTLQASVSATLADNAAYTWAVANAAVAQVNAAGLVTAKAPGETRLTATKADEAYTESLPLRVTEGGGEPGPGPCPGGQFFLFGETDENGVVRFGARPIEECGCQ